MGANSCFGRHAELAVITYITTIHIRVTYAGTYCSKKVSEECITYKLKKITELLIETFTGSHRKLRLYCILLTEIIEIAPKYIPCVLYINNIFCLWPLLAAFKNSLN